MYLESRGLAANTINQQLAAVRRLAHEAADAGLLSPELAAGISRVKGVKQLGFRAGNWLSAAQSSEVLQRASGEGMRARRDYAMLAMLFGCGFRRSELVGLELREIQIRQGHWAVVDLIGKGGHIRTVPIPEWVKAALDQWTRAAGVTEGRIFRAVARTGKVWGKGISQNVVWYVVRRCCERVGLEHIAPHDLRRTCAKLCHDSGGELEQIQFLLGHAAVQTTERYLGCKQNLGSRVNERFKPRTKMQARDTNFESAAVKGATPVETALAKAYNAATEDTKMSSPSSPIPHPHPNEPIWSRSEKAIAGAAFDAALGRELHEVIQEAKRMANEIQKSSDLWDLEHHLTQRRKEIDRTYDFRGSRLTDVLGRLLYENRLGEEDLRGLREEKMKSIRSFIKFLARMDAIT